MRQLVVVVAVLGVACGNPPASGTGGGDAAQGGGAASSGGGVGGGAASSGGGDGATGGGVNATGGGAGSTGGGASSSGGGAAVFGGGTGIDVDAGLDDCAASCDFTVGANEATRDLNAANPGDVVCLVADGGVRGRLTLNNVHGSDGAPITITNCGGAVHLNSPIANQRALIVDGEYFRVTGSGAAGVMYGLKLSAPEAPSALSFGRVHHVEVDRVEVDSSGFAGFTIKVDPSATVCQGNDRRFDSFVMTGVHLHHNFIHDVDGEAIYLGNSFYNGVGNQYCGASATCDWSACEDAGYPVHMQYPHAIRGVRVHHNVVARTGWDGIQVGSADDDCEISDNVVEDFGLLNVNAQNHGIQVGSGSSCRVLRNYVARGPQGLHLSGIGDTWAVNNVVLDIEGTGLIPNPGLPTCGDAGNNPCDDKIRPYVGFDGGAYKGGMFLFHNTVTNSVADAGFGLRRSGNNVFPIQEAKNNFFVSERSTYVQRPETWTLQNNLHVQTITGAGFLGAGDYRLTSSSPAVDAGQDLSSRGVTDDFTGLPRPNGGWDVGAYELR